MRILTQLFLLSLLSWTSIVLADVPEIEFNTEEQVYIQNNGVIKMCVDPDWMPFERLNKQGQHEGIAADLIRLVAERVGLRIEPVVFQTWDESLAASKSGECQILSFINQTPAREQWLIFTDPLYIDPNVIITREEHPYIANLKSLRNKTLVLPRGTSVEERVKRDFPNLSIMQVDDEEKAMQTVSHRLADLTIRSLAISAYTIRKEGYFNLKISGQIPEYTNHLRMGVIKDQPLLRDILNKGVATLTDQEREAVTNQHITINVQKAIDYRLVWQVLGVALLILLLSIFWISKLNKLNKRLAKLSSTDQLTGLNNRLKIDELFKQEIERCQRNQQDFGIILLDIDHFKQLNDHYGHLAGDEALVKLAKTLQTHTRKMDAVGRWGGEEFLILCPQTNEMGLLHLAEKLRKEIEQMPLNLSEPITISLGLTLYQKGDQINSMLNRADKALYQAKNLGRNRISTL